MLVTTAFSFDIDDLRLCFYYLVNKVWGECGMDAATFLEFLDAYFAEGCGWAILLLTFLDCTFADCTYKADLLADLLSDLFETELVRLALSRSL